ncbi:hypothetical protein DSO57_1003873 [Entomophthora muscae]|uniref:Uncharacterized protein n=1 Tax=Entomophthora muscae TaxID=34485 RepID=A0ACC2RN96_9FUNG|nr:hypothetical protein DSO57_1003873 [Entomophthora muscae]
MVAACRTAGIRLVMMTGDHPTTATAIARQIGLVTSLVPDTRNTLGSSRVTISCGEPCQGNAIVMCGEDIEALPPQLWDRLCEYRELVFARTSSTQKLKIVQAFQRRGHCVGVIGDGVNDAPSIRHADVGIAMGSSIEAALQAAKVVLMNNNLAMIPQAIENGRRVFVNTNSLLYVVPAGSLSETLPILGNTLLGIPQPLGSLLMTTISVITDLLPSVAVMAEDNRPHLMQQPPRDLQKQPLVRPWPLLRSFLFIGIPDSIMAHLAYFLYMYVAGGIYPTQLLFLFNQWREGYLGRSKADLMDLQYTAQSVFFATLISLQMIKNLLATHTDLRSLPSRIMSFNPNFWYLLTILFTLIVSALLMYLPLFNTYFNTRPIPLEAWGLAVALAGLGVIIFESRLVTQKLTPK